MFTKKSLALAVSVSAMFSGQALASDWALEEVTVTAQKRAQSMNDIGVAVSAFTGDQAERLGMSTAKDIAMQTPGLNTANAVSGGAPVFAIRGVGLEDFNLNNSSGVGVYLDDVYASSPAFLNGQMFDVERIEVLKGPQGTLYGRNTTGGAITVVSRKPTEDFEASISTSYDSLSRVETTGVVSGAVADNVQGRIAVNVIDQNKGIQKDIHTGQDLQKDEKQSFRALLAWQPTDNSDILFNIHGSNDDSISESPLNTGIPETDRRHVSISRLPQRDEKGAGGSIIANIDFDAFTLTSVTAYDKYDRSVFDNVDGDVLELNDNTPDAQVNQTSQEFRLTSNSDGNLSWIAGLTASQEEYSGATAVLLRNTVDLFVGAPLGTASGAIDTASEQRTQSLGAYLHTETQLSDEFKLTAGVRYSDDKIDYEGSVTDNTDIDPHNILDAGLSGIGAFAFAPTGTVLDSVSESNRSDNVSGRLALDYTPTDNLLLYTSVASGYKGGRHYGFAVTQPGALGYVDDEELISYELGIKATLLDNTMQLNAATFHTDYKNRQSLVVLDDLSQTLMNVPESEMSGAEIDITWRPTERLDIFAGASYLDTEITKGPGAKERRGLTLFEPIAGSKLPQSPKWQYNAMATYTIPLGDRDLFTQLDYAWEDQSFSQLADPKALNESHGSLNGRIGLADQAGVWEVALWGRNLTDEDAKIYGFPDFLGRQVGYSQEPRSFGITAKYYFF